MTAEPHAYAGAVEHYTSDARRDWVKRAWEEPAFQRHLDVSLRAARTAGLRADLDTLDLCEGDGEPARHAIKFQLPDTTIVQLTAELGRSNVSLRGVLFGGVAATTGGPAGSTSTSRSGSTSSTTTTRSPTPAPTPTKSVPSKAGTGSSTTTSAPRRRSTSSGRSGRRI
jgi:hypothetical protein